MPFARRRLLQFAALTMVVTGLVYAATTTFAVLLVVGFIGTMNPTSGDVSVFAPIEQSLVPSTTTDQGRTAMFAWYGFVGSIAGAFGALAVGVPEWLARLLDADPDAALRWVFVAYSLAGVVVFVVYRRLSAAVEPPAHQRPTALGPSRRIVMRLAAVFSLDSFGGGFVVQSLLALWLFRRFDLSVAAAGALLFWMGVCAAFSAFVSARLARRIGLVRTMVFTHMPAQVFLIAAAFMPELWMAVVLLDRPEPVRGDGRAGAQLVRDGGRVATRASRGRERDQRAARPGCGDVAGRCGMDARSKHVRVAARDRGVGEVDLRRAAAGDVPQHPPTRGAGVGRLISR